VRDRPFYLPRAHRWWLHLKGPGMNPNLAVALTGIAAQLGILAGVISGVFV
jgi:hypothetical protein